MKATKPPPPSETKEEASEKTPNSTNSEQESPSPRGMESKQQTLKDTYMEE